MDDFQLIPSVEPKRVKKLAGDPPARQLKLLDGLDCGPGQLDLFDDYTVKSQSSFSLENQMGNIKPEIATLKEIIDGIDDKNDSAWWEIVGIEEPEDEGAYIREHGDDFYRVSWPPHVSNPRYNSDACYQPLNVMTKRDTEEAKELLNDRAERFDVASVDDGGLCLTAHWNDGGQQVFYSLHDVKAWLTDRMPIRQPQFVTMKAIIINRDGVRAGVGALVDNQTIECTAELGSTHQDTLEIYEMIEEAVQAGKDKVVADDSSGATWTFTWQIK